MAINESVSESHPDTDLDVKPEVWSEVVGTPTAYDRDMIAETASIADAGLAEITSACRVGVTEREICLTALKRMARLGAEFLHSTAISTHVDIGSYSRGRSNLQPYLFTETKLDMGEMFWVDLIVCNEGYYVDCNRTISIGEPTNEQRELYDTCREMYEAMIDTIEPGVTGGTVWERAYEVAADAGYENYLNAIYLGHTTGITISEAPVISETETGEISDGQFLNIEPGLFVPDVGSACIENALHVTTDGAVPINEFDIDLVVV
jgi:Xaa-Pro aminopeptidase